MKWIYEKFKGDPVTYAICPKCNFYYNASKLNNKTLKYEINQEYKYCPMCREYLYIDSKIKIIRNKRNIMDLYENIK